MWVSIFILDTIVSVAPLSVHNKHILPRTTLLVPPAVQETLVFSFTSSSTSSLNRHHGINTSFYHRLNFWLMTVLYIHCCWWIISSSLVSARLLIGIVPSCSILSEMCRHADGEWRTSNNYSKYNSGSYLKWGAIHLEDDCWCWDIPRVGTLVKYI